MKKYYVKTTIHMQAKNKAWQELQDYAHEQNGTLVHGDEKLEEFIDEVATKIKEINEQFPRCADLSFKRENWEYQSVYASVYPDWAFSLTFLPINKEIQ